MEKNLNQYGLYRANPHAYQNNAMMLEACDCADRVACEDLYSGAIAPARAVTQVLYDGQVYTVNEWNVRFSNISISDTASLEAFFKWVFTQKEVDSIFGVTWLEGTPTGTFTVRHIGEGALEEIHLDDATVLETTRCCTVVKMYQYRATGVDAIPALSWGGNSETLANNPYPYTGVGATDEATAAQLQTDLGTALTNLGITAMEVRVSVDNNNAAYRMEFYMASTEAVQLGNSRFVVCGDKHLFNCA